MGGKTTTTSAAKIDPAVQALQLGNYSRAQGIADSPVTPYTGRLDLSATQNAAKGLMGFTPQQISAQTIGAQSVGTQNIAGAQLNRGNVRDVAPGSVGAADIARYMNPYEDQVVKTSLNDIDYSRQLTSQQGAARATSSHALGFSRDGVAQALTNEASGRTAASTAANLRSQGFTTALGAAQTEAARGLQAQLANQGVDVSVEQANALLSQQTQTTNAGFAQQSQTTNASLAQQTAMANAEAAQRADAANQSAGIAGAGIQLQGAGLMADTSQAQYAAQYQEFLRQQQDAERKQQLLNQSLSGVAAPVTTTETKAYNPGLFDYAQVGASLASSAAMFSDRRLKTQIKRIGVTDSGLPIYTYRYRSGGPVQMGVMAQEVQAVNPGAVHEIEGFLAVNYGALA